MNRWFDLSRCHSPFFFRWQKKDSLDAKEQESEAHGRVIELEKQVIIITSSIGLFLLVDSCVKVISDRLKILKRK